MRVTMIGPGLDVPGGMCTVATTLLASRALAGVQTDYLATSGPGRQGARLLRMAQGQARFQHMLATSPPDLFHVHVAHTVSVWRKLLYLRQLDARGLPFVLHVHGSRIQAFYERAPVHAKAVRWMLRRAARVLALSRHHAELFGGWLQGSREIDILHNPVPPRALQVRATREGPRRVIFLGALGSRKGASLLVQAAPRVLSRFPDTRFCLAGDGPRAPLLDQARRLGVADRVEVPGWLQGEDRWRELERAHLLCLPSYYEGVPLSVLEAMAAGLPVVATAVGGVPEVCIDGQTGLLVRPGRPADLADRICDLLSDPALGTQLGEAGRQRVRFSHDSERIATRLLGIWEQILADRI